MRDEILFLIDRLTVSLRLNLAENIESLLCLLLLRYQLRFIILDLTDASDSKYGQNNVLLL